MEDSVIGFGTLPADKFKLFQLLSPSIESHRAFHHILPSSTAVVSDISAPESEFSEDIACLINTVISNANASDRETPLSFNFDVSDSKTRLTMQALYIMKSLYKNVNFLSADVHPLDNKFSAPELKNARLSFSSSDVIYVSFEQGLLELEDMDKDLQDASERNALIHKWRLKIIQFREQLKSPDAHVIVYSDLFSGAAITRLLQCQQLFELTVYEHDITLISRENIQRLANDQLNFSPGRTPEIEKLLAKSFDLFNANSKEFHLTLKLLCLLLNKVSPNAVRAYYLKRTSERLLDGTSIPETVPKWLFDDVELSNVFVELNFNNGAAIERLANRLLQDRDIIDTPFLPFVSPVEFNGNDAIRRIRERINVLKGLIRSLTNPPAVKGTVEVSLVDLLDVDGQPLSNDDGRSLAAQYADRLGQFVLFLSDGNFLLCKIISKLENGNYIIDLNTSERPLAERATYSPHAVEKYGPWFPNELLLRLREDEIVSNQLSSARITEEMPQIASLLRRIDTEYGGDAPRDRGDEVGAEAGELEAKVEPVAEDGDTLKYDIVISKDKSQWRFKYYPPQWTPGTRFGASASLGLLLGGTAFLLRRHRLNFNKGEHYTTFDFIVKKTSPEHQAPDMYQVLRKCVGRLHGYLNEDIKFPTKSGIIKMQRSSSQRLEAILEQRKAANESFEWLKDEEIRVQKVARAKGFFDKELDALLLTVMPARPIAPESKLFEDIKALEKPTDSNYDFNGESYWDQIQTKLDAHVEQRTIESRVAIDPPIVGYVDTTALELKRNIQTAIKTQIVKFYRTLKTEGLFGGDIEALQVESEQLQLELAKIQATLNNRPQDMFRLARMELENSLLLDASEQMTISQFVIIQEACSSKLEQSLYNAIPTLIDSSWIAQHIRRNGQTLFKRARDADPATLAIHVQNELEPGNKGTWTSSSNLPPFAPNDKDKLAFVLSITKYLAFYEMCIREQDTRHFKSSLPHEFLSLRLKNITHLLKYSISLALLAFELLKSSSGSITGRQQCSLPSSVELRRLLRQLQDSHVTLMPVPDESSAISIARTVALDTSISYSLVTSNIFEILNAQLIVDPKNEHDLNIGIYHPLQQITLTSNICNQMKSYRKKLCRQLWWLSQTFLFGNKLYNRGFFINSRIDEDARNATKNTLVKRFGKSVALTFPGMRNLTPERYLFSSPQPHVPGNSIFKNTVIKYIRRTAEQDSSEEIGQAIRHALGLTCISQQLWFAASIEDMSFIDKVKLVHTI
tara:strand:+ start:1003 stop:4761 length:3759 start_codon:yes stop_codon:yes gene_type:complete